jgi:hypothetical protein
LAVLLLRAVLPLREPPRVPVLLQALLLVGQGFARPAPDRPSPARLAPPEPGTQERKKVQGPRNRRTVWT